MTDQSSFNYVFPKMIEEIMYKRLFNHLSKHNVLYLKPYFCSERHLTEHVVVQLIDQIKGTLMQIQKFHYLFALI